MDRKACVFLVLALLSSCLLACGDVGPDDSNLKKEPPPRVQLPKIDASNCNAETLFAHCNTSDKIKAAETYLQHRAAQWRKNEGARKYGQGTACISCHTTLPYILSVAGTQRTTPSNVEKALIDDITQRVNNWEKVQPWYNWNEEKSRQTRGTEAVINAVALGLYNKNKSEQGISQSSLLALDHLWKEQIKEGEHAGSWHWMDFNLAPWEDKTGRYWGAALVAVMLGQMPKGYTQANAIKGHPNSQKLQKNLTLLRNYLKKGYQEKQINLHNKVMLLWATTQWTGLLNASAQKALAKDIMEKQLPDGGWSLAAMGKWPRSASEVSRQKSDGYATGLTVYVLGQVQTLEDKRPIHKGIMWLIKNQSKEHGNWKSISVNSDREGSSSARFMDDAATAFATMALSGIR